MPSRIWLDDCHVAFEREQRIDLLAIPIERLVVLAALVYAAIVPVGGGATVVEPVAVVRPPMVVVLILPTRRPVRHIARRAWIGCCRVEANAEQPGAGSVVTVGTRCAFGNGTKTVCVQEDCGSFDARKNNRNGNASSTTSITE